MSLFELSFLARQASASAGSWGASRRSSTLRGLSLGVHLDDGDPRFAFYVGFEALSWGQDSSAYMTSLVLAPRTGFHNGLFLALPVGVTSVGGATSIYAAPQVGVAY